MKVKQLVALLQEANQDADVLMVYQQNYPLQSYVAGIWSNLVDRPECDECEGTGCGTCGMSGRVDFEGPEIIYVVEGGSVYDQPYGPRRAFENYVK
mgnify:CR=1 FL=1